MAEKKGILGKLFKGKSGGCCDMKIIDEDNTKAKKSGCCDMQIVEDEPRETAEK